MYTCLAVTLTRVASTRWLTSGKRIDYTPPAVCSSLSSSIAILRQQRMNEASNLFIIEQCFSWHFHTDWTQRDESLLERSFLLVIKSTRTRKQSYEVIIAVSSLFVLLCRRLSSFDTDLTFDYSIGILLRLATMYQSDSKINNHSSTTSRAIAINVSSSLVSSHYWYTYTHAHT